MSINSVCFSGNLVADPAKFGTAENPGIDFTLAINCPKRVGNEWQDEALYLDMVLYGKRAASMSEILKKGMNVTIAGRMVPANYVNKEGKTVYKQRVVVNEIQLPRREQQGAPVAQRW